MNTKLKVAVLSTVLIAIAFIAGFLSVTAILTTTKTLPTSSTIVTDVSLSVYDSISATTEIISINWGTLLPTETKTFKLYIQNDATINMSISITSQNWNPTYAEDSINFTYSEGSMWSGHYPILCPNQRASIWLDITANENPPSGDFSFDVVITGTTL